MTHKDAHLARIRYRSRCEGWPYSRTGFYYAATAMRQPLSILTRRTLR